MKFLSYKNYKQCRCLKDGLFKRNRISTASRLRTNLPAGFEWVSLNNIDPAALLKRDNFSAGKYAELRIHLESLRYNILPIVKSNPEADRHQFRMLDNRRRWQYRECVFPVKLERTYELFFEADHICLCRQPRATLFGVTNGRHRISIARDIGWSEIPAKLNGV